jgi:hypothetical protein
MRFYPDLSADIEHHYHEVCVRFERLIGKLSQPSCQSRTHGEIEEFIHPRAWSCCARWCKPT